MQIRAFKAFRYNPAVVGDVGSCIAPPYDIIGPAEQQRLCEKDPYNIVRITKGKAEPTDTDGDNQYTRACEYLKTWIEKGILKQDTEETIYAYVQDFELAGQNLRRFSFIAKSKLEPFGKIVKPHEQTFDEPLADRMNLIRATSAVFGLVFMLYEDPERVVEEIIQKAVRQKPLTARTDEQSTCHRLYAINTQQDIEKITKMMSDKSCIIADGHHRYTTSVAFAKEYNSPAAKYQMLAFANTRQKGLVILATHRLAGNIKNLDFEKFIRRLNENFELTEYKSDTEQAKQKSLQKMLEQIKKEYNRKRNSFGIYGGTGSFYAAVLKNAQLMDSAAPEKNAAWKALDVSVLQRLVIEKQLRLVENGRTGTENIEYFKDTPGAIDMLVSQVDTHKKQIAFFMNPVRLQQLIDVVESCERMPQKSTYFYPKLYSGLVIDII